MRTQAADDVRDALTPRRPARSLRFTTARISSPRRVWRRTSHSAIAANAAATKTATWSELSETPLSPIESRCHVWRGLGPMPRTVPLPEPVVTGSPKSRTVLPNASTSHKASAGSAMSRPIDPTIRAYIGAAARRRSRIRSRARPSSGAKISTEISAAGTTGTPRPVFSWKKT